MCEVSGQCDKTEYCDADEKRCFIKQGLNSKCNLDEECQGHCNGADSAKGGFCVDPVDVDGSCDATSWCKEGLECTSGKCVKPGPDVRLAATCGGK